MGIVQKVHNDKWIFFKDFVRETCIIKLSSEFNQEETG